MLFRAYSREKEYACGTTKKGQLSLGNGTIMNFYP